MTLTLRPYQEEALDRVAKAEADGCRRQLLVMATGLGKTVVFCELARRRGGRTLVLAHRDELVVQAAAKVLELWPDLGASSAVVEQLRASEDPRLRSLGVRARLDNRGVGIVKGPARDTRARVVVASVQTVSRPERLSALIAPTVDTGWLAAEDGFDLVVVDEAHHATAPSYAAVVDGLRAGASGCRCGEDHERAATPEEVDAGCELGVAFDPCPNVDPGPLLLGVTATPDRADGKGLAAVFKRVVASYDILWGIRAGYLSDVRGRRVRLTALDLGDVKVSRGDYEAGAAGAALERAGAPRHIVEAWRREADGRKTVVFTPTVATAERTAEEFRAAGVAAGFVHGGTPVEERRATLAAFSTGALRVVANCAVLTEGYDEPTIDCVVVARPTRSRALYAQMVGRGTRRHPDKDHLLVLDVVGATDEHSLVTIPSLFGVRDAKTWERSGKGVAERLAEQDAEDVRLGVMRAEDAELFAQVRGANVAWVQVHREGDALRRYHRTLGKGADGAQRPTVVLAQRSEESWTAGLWWQAEGRKDVLVAEASFETAQGVAEDYVRAHGGNLTKADAAWRRRKPSRGLRSAAERWRLKDAKGYKTAGELSDALDAHVERIKLGQANRRKR